MIKAFFKKSIKLYFKAITYALCAVLLFLSHTIEATHIRAGEIIVKRKGCTSFTFEIIFTGYRDTRSDVVFGEGYLDFGDGSTPLLITRNDFEKSPAGNNIEKNILTKEHRFPASGTYIISYRELNRNAGTLNIDNSVDTPFYVESQIIIDSFVGCNQTPQLLIPPVDEGCTQTAFHHNAGAFDPDGDSLSYEFTVPKQDKGVTVANYRDPNTNEPALYPNGYNNANENGDGPPTFTINPRTGDVVWDSPGAEGQYNIAFKIIEWRNLRGRGWTKIGYVVRDMQILIKDCDNNRPELQIPKDICVEAGTTIDETITGNDPDSDPVEIVAVSQLFNEEAFQPPVFIPKDGFRAVPAISRFTWNTDCQHVRKQPYQVVFKITDKPDSGPKLVSFATWKITVVGPKPNLISATRVGRSAQLSFSPYICKLPKGIKIQIWRRVASYPYTPSECETGLPANSGYQLIDNVDISTTSYTDDNKGKGLAWGAKYCYRLIAVFPGKNKTESIVSDEKCIEPIKASAPIITHASVLETNETSGRVRVSWRSPFELDLNTFTLPLKYTVEHAEGFSGDKFSLKATLNDTTYDDKGLNTQSKAYRYRITAYDANDTKIESSVVASTVRLVPRPQAEKIELNWSANVPWSNLIAGQPHELWRDNIDANDPKIFKKIADVEVTTSGMKYLDEGQHNSVPLDKNKTYCYYVRAKGSYGNPLIASPQINDSQITCSQPSDDIAPCISKLIIDRKECRPIGSKSGKGFFDDKECGYSNFNNKLKWNVSKLCGEDVAFYEVYYKRELNDKYVKIQHIVNQFAVGDTVRFEHTGLSSFAGCYVVKAVDRSGNESKLSNEVCQDNCINYILPNVFTPGHINGLNDTFRAFGHRDDVKKAGKSFDYSKCARFVKSVNFIVFNRWGKTVFTYDSKNAKMGGEGTIDIEKAIYINWDGRGDNGKELASGVYFYRADVTFDALDPKNKQRTIKGWIHLLR